MSKTVNVIVKCVWEDSEVRSEENRNQSHRGEMKKSEIPSMTAETEKQKQIKNINKK